MNKSIMWRYIKEEPASLHELLKSNQISIFLKECPVEKIDKIVFVSSGSSYNITLVAKKLYEELAQIDVKSYAPFDFVSNAKIMQCYNRDTTLVIAISQTGTSSGTINAIAHAKNLGFPVLTLTERRNTPIQEMGDYYLNFLSGLEDCNAKTKGYCNSLTLLQLLAIYIAKQKNSITDELLQSYIHEITASIEDVHATVASTIEWIEMHKYWSTINHFTIIGNGTNYGTAVEGMLKILETMCIPASVCELGEFSHGFHRMINHNSNLITILTEEHGIEDMIQTNEYLLQKAGKVLVINASKTKYNDSHYINIPYRPLTSSALNISVALQVIAVALPEIIGHDPNYPMNDDFTKIVSTRV